MSRMLVAACLLTIAAPGFAEERPEAWTEATRLFQVAREKLMAGEPSRGPFRRAAEVWVKAAHTHHPEGFLNQGNAHYLAGELPEALAAFNAGLNVDPSNSRLHENLALARRDVSLPAGSKLVGPAWAWQRYLFQSWLDAVALIAVIASIVLLPASLRLGRWIVVGMAAATVAAALGLAIFVRTSYLDDIDRRPVCVLRVDTPLRVGNADSYASHSDAAFLPRGYEVRRLGKRGAWLHVECAGGQIGWVPETNVIAFGLMQRYVFNVLGND